MLVDQHRRGGELGQQQLRHRARQAFVVGDAWHWHEGFRHGGGVRGRVADWKGLGVRHPGPGDPTVDARPLINGIKQGGLTADGLGAPQHQHPAGPQGIVEHRHQPVLQRGAEVDQQVAAAQQVQSGEGRVGGQVMVGEDDRVAQGRHHAPAAVTAPEEALLPLGRQRLQQRVGIHPAAGAGDGVVVQVSGKQLQPAAGAAGHLGGHLGEHHRQRVRLFSGGAARHPGAQRFALGHGAGHQIGQHRLLQAEPGGLIAKEAGHTDQQLLEQQVDLLRVVAQRVHVGGQRGQAVQGHAACCAAAQRAGLVGAEVMPGAGVQQRQHGGQGVVQVVGVQRVDGVCGVG